MRPLLGPLKWLFWGSALCLAGLLMWAMLRGKGGGGIFDWLLTYFYCAAIATPGLLIHLFQRLTRDDR